MSISRGRPRPYAAWENGRASVGSNGSTHLFEHVLKKSMKNDEIRKLSKCLHCQLSPIDAGQSLSTAQHELAPPMVQAQPPPHVAPVVRGQWDVFLNI